MTEGSVHTCDNCAQSVSMKDRTVDGYTIYNCGSCNLKKVYPNPTTEELQELYSGVDRNIAKGATQGEIDSFKKNSEQVISVLNSMRIAPLAKFFPQLKKSSAICDVGCGSGIYLAALQKLGYSNLYGLEFNKDSVELINQEFDFKKVVAGEISVQDDFPKLDLITAYDVLEHVPDPSAKMREIGKMLADDGCVHIRVPNYGSLWGKIFGKKWLWMIPPFHLNYFDYTSLKNMAQDNGFEIIKLRSRRSGYRIAFWFLQLKMLLKGNIDSFDSNAYSKNGLMVINLVEMIFRFFYLPFYLVAQLFNADDCLELYARKARK